MGYNSIMKCDVDIRKDLYANTVLSGVEDPSWLPCQLSNRCGSPNKNMMNPVLPLYTGSASKAFFVEIYFTTPPAFRDSPTPPFPPPTYHAMMISTFNLE